MIYWIYIYGFLYSLILNIKFIQKTIDENREFIKNQLKNRKIQTQRNSKLSKKKPKHSNPTEIKKIGKLGTFNPFIVYYIILTLSHC